MYHRALIKWLICFAVLAVTSYFFPLSLGISGGLISTAVAATLLWIINLTVKPVFQLFSLPFTILTFGLFSLVINALMIAFADFLMPQLHVSGFFVCLAMALAISVLNSLFTARGR